MRLAHDAIISTAEYSVVRYEAPCAYSFLFTEPLIILYLVSITVHGVLLK